MNSGPTVFDELTCYGVPLKQAMNSGATVFNELSGNGVR